MSLLPESASYVEVVADFFLAHARGGLVLSSIDTDLVLEWEQAGIPSEVVCRGITIAHKTRARNVRPADAPLRSLVSCAWAVEKEWWRHREASTGKATTEPLCALTPTHLCAGIVRDAPCRAHPEAGSKWCAACSASIDAFAVDYLRRPAGVRDEDILVRWKRIGGRRT